ncbi:MAG TPA: hypothetical protein VLA83_12485 [Candidatus Binatia bacterium]|nr:hypothetical protein [Candidatus Binatia bacterium]
MFTNTQDAGKEMDAGLYMRARKQIRSWSWSWGRVKKKLTDVADAETERPWAGLAEWLRVAHSMLDEKAVELTRNAEQ